MIGIMERKFDGKIEITGFQLPGLSYFVKSALLSLTIAIYGNNIRGFSGTYSAHMETLIILLLTVMSKKDTWKDIFRNFCLKSR